MKKKYEPPKVQSVKKYGLELPDLKLDGKGNLMLMKDDIAERVSNQLSKSIAERLLSLSESIDPRRPNRQILHGLRIHLRNIAREVAKLEEKVGK